MFSDYYTFYVKGTLGGMNYKKGIEGSFLFQKNPYEQTDNSVAGIDWRTTVGADWKISFKTYGALSDYVTLNKKKITGMVEASYQGVIGNTINLNGATFYSSGYFPGNRRGATSFYQGVSRRLSDKMFFSGSFSYNKSEPKSYTYIYNYKSINNYGNLSLSLPKVLNITPSLQYLYQYESSNSYSLMGLGPTDTDISMKANRMSLQLRWQSRNSEHSVYGNVQTGLYGDVFNNRLLYQGKYSLSYSYNGLTLSTSYQNGAFYIYEQLKAKMESGQFNRTSMGGAYNKMLGKKISFTTSFNLSNDSYQGIMYSVNGSAKYSPVKNLSLFTNGYWSKYDFMGITLDSWNFEVGITYNFNKTRPSSKRKSKLIAQVYYDKNLNNQFDKDEEPVSDYLVDISNKIFRQDTRFCSGKRGCRIVKEKIIKAF
jgi:hypothetical protein